MSVTTIEINVPLELPPMVVRDATMHVLDAIAAADPRYRDLTLSMALAGGARVGVPIDVRITSRPQRWEAAIHIEAAKSERFFPTFDGTISATPNGPHEAELWMQGSYVPPGGILGEGLDATLMRGRAEESLHQFLAWLAREVRHEAQRAERERLEQARQYHG